MKSYEDLWYVGGATKIIKDEGNEFEPGYPQFHQSSLNNP